MDATPAFIPVTLANNLPSFRHPLDVNGIQRAITKVLTSALYTEIPVDELIEMLDPPKDPRDRRGNVLSNATHTQFDKRCAYELRYRKGFNFSQAGLSGRLEEGLFAVTVEWMYNRELKVLQDEQPNCEWRLVAAFVDQVNTSAVYQKRMSEDEASTLGQVRAQGDDHYRKMKAGQNVEYLGSKTTEIISAPDIRWCVPMVFADIAKAGLVDPNQVDGEAKTTTNDVYQYIETRQLKYMSNGARKNRAKAVELLKRWETAQQDGAWKGVPQPLAFSAEQLEAARAMRLAGVAPAQIAGLLQVDVDWLNAALDKAPPTEAS